VDPGSPRVMERSPRGSGESILTPRRRVQIVVQGLLITLGALTMYLAVEFGWVTVDGQAHAQTMLFTTIVLSQLLHAFNFRSETRSVFRRESLANRWLLAAFAGSMGLQALVIYTPALQSVFKTQPLGIHDWIAVLIAAIVPIIAIDIVKVVGARMRRN